MGIVQVPQTVKLDLACLTASHCLPKWKSCNSIFESVNMGYQLIIYDQRNH